MIESHPTLSVFGTTVLSTFPLILVVGREPNNNLPIAPGIGPYDFRRAPYCGFWNTSYSAVARTLNMTTKQLKALSVQRCGSPIVYADALPISLPDHVANKNTYRTKVIENRPRLEAHIRAIFAHHELTARVRLVLASGLYGPTFNEPVALLTAEARLHDIPVVQVPFFYGTNAKRIQEALSMETRTIIAGVVRDFRLSAG